MKGTRNRFYFLFVVPASTEKERRLIAGIFLDKATLRLSDEMHHAKAMSRHGRCILPSPVHIAIVNRLIVVMLPLLQGRYATDWPHPLLPCPRAGCQHRKGYWHTR